MSASRPWPPADMLAEWEHVLEALSQENRVRLQGGYEHAKLLSWNERGVVLGFAPEFFEMWADDKKEMTEFLRRHYDRPVSLDIELLSDSPAGSAETPSHGARSVEDVKQERAAELERQKRAEVYAHPSYKRLEERFGPFAKVEMNPHV